MIHKGSINKAYLQLQKVHRESLYIQRVRSIDLNTARVRVASTLHQRLAPAPSTNGESCVLAPSPPPPPLSAQELRAVRLKYFGQQHLSGAIDGHDTPCHNERADKPTLCFQGEVSTNFAHELLMQSAHLAQALSLHYISSSGQVKACTLKPQS